MQKKLSLLLILGLGLGLSILILPKAQAIEYYGGLIVYEQDGKIIKNLINAGYTEEIGTGTLPALSPNKKHVAFYDAEGKLVIYHINSGQTDTLTTSADYAASMEPAQQPLWSENNKKLIATYVVDGLYTSLMVRRNDVFINSFPSAEGKALWLNKNNVIYTNIYAWDNVRSGEDSYADALGIAKYNSKTQSGSTLISPDEYNNYSLTSIKNHKIIYTKETCSDWSAARLCDTNYYKMGKNGGHIINIEVPQTGEEKIISSLPAPYFTYSVEDFGAFGSGKWHLFTLRETTTSNPVIFIIKLGDSASLFSVDAGDHPSW